MPSSRSYFTWGPTSHIVRLSVKWCSHFHVFVFCFTVASAFLLIFTFLLFFCFKIVVIRYYIFLDMSDFVHHVYFPHSFCNCTWSTVIDILCVLSLSKANRTQRTFRLIDMKECARFDHVTLRSLAENPGQRTALFFKMLLRLNKSWGVLLSQFKVLCCNTRCFSTDSTQNAWRGISVTYARYKNFGISRRFFSLSFKQTRVFRALDSLSNNGQVTLKNNPFKKLSNFCLR